MANVNLMTSLKVPLRIKIFSPVTDDLSEAPDVVHEHKRFLTTVGVPSDYTLLPGVANSVDSGFWAQFQSQSATSSLLLNHVIYQVP
jgi:hypothetical protein